MSFFDPANVFGGGGSNFRDPLGLFGGGRRQMTPQELAQARGGGGQSQRGNAFGGGFGGASGFRGQGFQESDFGGPAEMAAPAPQAQPQWGGLANALAAQNQGKGPASMGPNRQAMMSSMGQPAGGYQYGQGGMVRGNGTVKGDPRALGNAGGAPVDPALMAMTNRFRGRGP